MYEAIQKACIMILYGLSCLSVTPLTAYRGVRVRTNCAVVSLNLTRTDFTTRDLYHLSQPSNLGAAGGGVPCKRWGEYMVMFSA